MAGTIGRDELVAAIDRGRVTVVDALGAAHHQHLRLPGAVHLPPTEVVLRARHLLPDRDAAIVTYCSGASCSASRNVAAALERLGYTDVRRYPGGLEDWQAAGLPLEGAGAAPEAPALPAGCELPAARGSLRVRSWRDVGTRAVGLRAAAGWVSVTLPRDEALLADVRELVAAEASCCAAVAFEIRDAGDAAELLVTAERPDDVAFFAGAFAAARG